MSKGIWMEDLHVGDRFYSGDEIEVTAQEIMGFARAYDPQAGHVSEETAVDTVFKGLAASGWHTAAITMKLLVGLGFAGMIGTNVSLTWPSATRPGDRLHIDVHVTGKRNSKTKPDRGVVDLEYETVNQTAEVRQRTQATVIVWHKGASQTR